MCAATWPSAARRRQSGPGAPRLHNARHRGQLDTPPDNQAAVGWLAGVLEVEVLVVEVEVVGAVCSELQAGDTPATPHLV